MKLKTSVSSRTTSSGQFLIIAIVAMTIAIFLTSVFPGCTKKEEAPMEATRQLVIPSELEPKAVLPDFGGQDYYECIYEVGKEVETSTKGCTNGLQDFVKGRLEKDFVKGYWRGYYIYSLKSGEQIGVHHDVLRIVVLQYKTQQAAEEAFAAFAEILDLKDLIFDGVKIKGAESERGYPGPTYMLQSNMLVIFLDGNLEACRDAISRILELYSVPIDNKY